MRRLSRSFLSAFLSILGFAPTVTTSSVSGDELNTKVSFITSSFLENPSVGEDRSQLHSLNFGTEVYLGLSDRLSLTIEPYLQYEHGSDTDVHQDLRKFLFLYSADDWELQAGIGQESWGVAESRRVVDIVNQTDYAAGLLESKKLGQPIVKLTGFSRFGDFSLIALPGFREPAYASFDSRPRVAVDLNSATTSYEAKDGDSQIDFAFRWAGSINNWDIGFHGFSGIRRDPVLRFSPSEGLTERFVNIKQIGLDAQVTYESLAFKFEAIELFGDEVDRHYEFVTGLEYTLTPFEDGQFDVGVVAELLYDSRKELATHPFENDLMLGVRLMFNDVNSSQAQLSAITDWKNSSKMVRFDYSRRVAQNFRVSVQGNWLTDTKSDVILREFNLESNIVTRLDWYF